MRIAVFLLLCSTRRESRKSYRPDGVCHEGASSLAPHFGIGAAFVICQCPVKLIWTQSRLHVCHVLCEDLRYLGFAQVFAVFCSSGICRHPCPHGSEFVPVANTLSGGHWLPDRAVLQTIWIVEEDGREHLFQAPVHLRCQTGLILQRC